MVKIVCVAIVVGFLYYLARRAHIRFVASSGDDGNKL
jgi:hypothetical protein